MTPISFPESNTVIAKDQPEYIPLPAFRANNAEGELVCCWKLGLRERLVLLFTGELWHSIWTFNKPLQPQLLSVDKPQMIESKP